MLWMKNYISLIIVSMVLYSSCKHPDTIPSDAQISCSANYSVYHSGDSIPLIVSHLPQSNYPFDSAFALLASDISFDSIWQIAILYFTNRTIDTTKIAFNARGNGKDTIGLILD